MKNVRLIIFVSLIALVICSLLYLKLHSWDDGRFLLVRDYSDETFDALATKNDMLKRALHPDGSLKLENFKEGELTEKEKSIWVEICRPDSQSSLKVHREFLWSYHLAGGFKSGINQIEIPMEQGIIIISEVANKDGVIFVVKKIERKG